MSEIKNKNLYPEEETPLLKHYSEFDNVYIGLLPFFKLNKESCETYPTNEEISKGGKIITWRKIVENAKLNNYQELNKALMTSIGGLKKKLERKDLLEVLNQYTEAKNIWYPEEGTFDFFCKSSIYDILKSNGITKIEVEDEFYENSKTIDISNLSKNEFCKKIEHNDYYIYDNNKSIQFSISWDFFFFFIAINEQDFSKQKIETHFEGFWADEKSSHLWTWEEGEIERLLNSEN
jgi:hypothetical protein